MNEEQIKAAIIESVNDNDIDDAEHYVLEWRRLREGESESE